MVLKELVDKIIKDGRLTTDEFQQFKQAIDADGQIDLDEIEQIDRMFGMIEEGQLEFVP